jgi:hypothetical protein
MMREARRRVISTCDPDYMPILRQMSAILEGVKVPAPSSAPTPPRPVGLSLGGLPTPFTPANGEFVRVAIRAELAVTSPEGYVLDTVRFVFQQRVASPLLVTVVGMDATRALTVTLQIQNDSRSARLSISYREEHASRPMHARQLYPLMRFLAKIRPPNRIGIVINGRSMAEDPVPEGYGTEIATEFLELLRRLAHLQDVSGVDFPLPDEFTSLDVAWLAILATAQVIYRTPLRRRATHWTPMAHPQGWMRHHISCIFNAFQWRGLDLNQRPSGYEPDELVRCRVSVCRRVRTTPGHDGRQAHPMLV